MRAFQAIIGLALLLLTAGGAAGAGEIAADDRQAIRSIIEAQLAAFRAEDGARAFSYAAPRIKAKFRSSEIFMRMVKNGYPAIYASRKASFIETVVHGEAVLQKVVVIGADGLPATALYEMQKQPDGTWLINGCALLRNAEAGA